MYRIKEEQLIYDLEQYYLAFQINDRDYQETFYEEVLKLLLRGELVKNIRFPDDENGGLLLNFDMELVDYLAENIKINGATIPPHEIRKIQRHILPVNRPFDYGCSLYMYKDKEIRSNVRKVRSYYRKLPGFRMPACPENVTSYLKGSINLYPERRK